MESDLPWIPGALKALLLADLTFKADTKDRVFSGKPKDVSEPFVLARAMDNSVITLSGGGYQALVQIEGCCPEEYAAEDPAFVVWRFADRAKRILQAAKNVQYQTMHYSMRTIGMGTLPADGTRGDANPIERCGVRAEMTIHNR